MANDDKPDDTDDIMRKYGVDALRRALEDPANVVHLDNHRGKPRVLSEAQFLKTVSPIDWIVRRIIQRGMVYTFTAHYGTGKTTIGVLLAYLVGAREIEPRRFGPYDVKPGHVVILAGETPQLVARLMIACRKHYGITGDASISVVPGRFSLKTQWEEVVGMLPQRPMSLVIVDTAASFFEGDEENANSQMHGFAHLLRRMSTDLPGNPAVVVLAHPKMAATKDDMVPRGGSAFSGELDGNLALWREGEGLFEFYHTAKIRSGGFDPVQLEIVSFSDPVFNDADGHENSMPVARVISESESDERQDREQTSRERVLEWISFSGEDGCRLTDIATGLDFNKGTIHAILQKLLKAGVIDKNGSLYQLASTKKRQPKSTKRKKGDASD